MLTQRVHAPCVQPQRLYSLAYCPRINVGTTWFAQAIVEPVLFSACMYGAEVHMQSRNDFLGQDAVYFNNLGASNCCHIIGYILRRLSPYNLIRLINNAGIEKAPEGVYYALLIKKKIFLQEVNKLLIGLYKLHKIKESVLYGGCEVAKSYETVLLTDSASSRDKQREMLRHFFYLQNLLRIACLFAIVETTILVSIGRNF